MELNYNYLREINQLLIKQLKIYKDFGMGKQIQIKTEKLPKKPIFPPLISDEISENSKKKNKEKQQRTKRLKSNSYNNNNDSESDESMEIQNNENNNNNNKINRNNDKDNKMLNTEQKNENGSKTIQKNKQSHLKQPLFWIDKHKNCSNVPKKDELAVIRIPRMQRTKLQNVTHQVFSIIYKKKKTNKQKDKNNTHNSKAALKNTSRFFLDMFHQYTECFMICVFFCLCFLF